MDDAAVKETRRVLRQVQNHLIQSRIHLGVTCEHVGLVDVLYHPENSLPELNYVTPRKNTAWISAKDVQQGLEALSKRNRLGRVEFIEGLFLPVFAKSLREIGLTVEREVPLMVYQHTPGNLLPLPPMPDGVSIDRVKNHEGSSLWWYVWRNAYYDVVTQTAEPIFVGQSVREVALGHEIDLVVHRYRFPVGVARVTICEETQTAHIAAMALMNEVRSPEMLKLLQGHAIQVAIQRKCTLVFTTGDTEQDRHMSRENGFVDYGSLVCYAEKVIDNSGKDFLDDRVVQPVLTFR